MLGDCCETTCKAYLKDPSLKGGAGATVELEFNFPDQSFRSPSFKVGSAYHSWRLFRHYNSITLQLVSGASTKSVTVDLPPSPVPGVIPPFPTWDAEFDFTGEEPIDDVVRAYRTGACNSITLKAVDPCPNGSGVNVIQSGTVTYYVYRESDKKLITQSTSDDDGRVIIFGLKEDEDYRITAYKAGCGSGSAKITGLVYGTDYTVPVSCTKFHTFTFASMCFGLAGTNPPFGFSNLLPGSSISLTMVGTDHWFSGTADGNAKLYWVPPASGNWIGTVSHPSGRFYTGPYFVTTNTCTNGATSITMPAANGYSCCADGTIRSPIPIKLPLLCVTDRGASWTQGPGTSGHDCSGRGIIPVMVDRMGPYAPKYVQCNPATWCSWNKEPDGLAAGTITMALSVTVMSAIPTNTIPPTSGTVGGQYGAAWNFAQWPAGEDCNNDCFPGPKEQKWSAWWYDDPTITGGGQLGDRWELLSASPFVARVYFDTPSNGSYTGVVHADGSSDGKAPLPRAIKYITVSES